MRPLFPALAAALLTLGPTALRGEPDVLTHLPPGHPRLLCTDAQLQAARARNDPLERALEKKIIGCAEADLGARPIEYKLIGPRLLDKSRTAVERITVCAMAYRLTGDERFLKQAKTDLATVVAFPDWHPAHYLDVAEMSFAVGIGYDWLYAQLTPAERAATERALEKYSLSFVPAAYGGPQHTDKRVYWVDVAMNWNQVCNAGMLTAALAIADLQPDTARQVIKGVRRSLPLAMAAYQPEGAYPEGPGYWAYGTTYNVIALAEMEGCLGTTFGLAETPAFDKTAFYRLAVQGPTGLVFNYADGGATAEASPAFSWLAHRFGPGAAQDHARELLAEECRRPGGHDRFLALNEVWFPAGRTEVEAKSVPTPLDVHFRGRADIAMFRSAWGDPKALFVGFKAGTNAVNHAHLDLGSFVLEADGVRWAEDLGPDNYNLPEYFGKLRWTYFRLNNHSHNTVTPGGMLQDPKATAPIVAFGSTPEKGFAIADMSQVYPTSTERLWRGVAILGRSRVLIQDEWTPSQFWLTASGRLTGSPQVPAPLNWALATPARVKISADGRTATLSQGSKRLLAQILAPESAHFEVGPAKPPQADENQNKGTSMLRTRVPSAQKVRLAILLTPGMLHLPPPDIVPLSEWR